MAQLTQPELLALWAERSSQELGGLAEPALLGHIQRLLKVAARLGGYGAEALAEIDPAGLDDLLADVLACAVWESWPHGLTDLGEADVELGSAQAGICGASSGAEGVGLWRLPDGRLALTREREAGAQADFRHHWGGERPPH